MSEHEDDGIDGKGCKDPASEQRPGETSGDKGKGKEKTMLENIWTSGKMAAEALASGALSFPGLSGPSAKATSSSYSASGPTSTALENTPTSQRHQTSDQINIESFKSGQAAAHSNSFAFDEFVGSHHDSRIWTGLYQPHLPGPSSDSQAAEAMDGSAVVDILSQPMELEFDAMTPPDEGDEMLNPQDMQRLRDALFQSPHKTEVSWDHLLNFTPTFVTSPEASAEARGYLGNADPEVVRETWLNQWHTVLSAYTDDVWGDLGPLAAKAREEIETSGLDGLGEGALGRLRMILAHVRGYS